MVGEGGYGYVILQQCPHVCMVGREIPGRLMGETQVFFCRGLKPACSSWICVGLHGACACVMSQFFAQVSPCSPTSPLL